MSRELSPTARHAALTLAIFADPDGSRCHPSLATLAQRMGVSRETAKRALRELVAGGWLLRAMTAGRTNTYVPTVPAATEDEDHDKTRVTSDPPPGSPATPNLPSYLPREGEEGRSVLQDEVADLIATVDPQKAERVRTHPEVANAAHAAEAAGRTGADVRATWAEAPPDEIRGGGPRLAEKLLSRVAAGERLPAKKRAGASRPGGRRYYPPGRPGTFAVDAHGLASLDPQGGGTWGPESAALSPLVPWDRYDWGHRTADGQVWDRIAKCWVEIDVAKGSGLEAA